jgi:hypothetical protein
MSPRLRLALTEHGLDPQVVVHHGVEQRVQQPECLAGPPLILQDLREVDGGPGGLLLQGEAEPLLLQPAEGLVPGGVVEFDSLNWPRSML